MNGADSKIFNTDNTIILTEYWNGLRENDCYFVSEILCVTDDKEYFLWCTGGALTEYAKIIGGRPRRGETVIEMSKEKAITWLLEHNEDEVIEEFFEKTMPI